MRILKKKQKQKTQPSSPHPRKKKKKPNKTLQGLQRSDLLRHGFLKMYKIEQSLIQNQPSMHFAPGRRYTSMKKNPIYIRNSGSLRFIRQFSHMQHCLTTRPRMEP